MIWKFRCPLCNRIKDNGSEVKIGIRIRWICADCRKKEEGEWKRKIMK